MTKVTGPLFSVSASGQLRDIGTFKNGRYGPEFIPLNRPAGKKPEPAVPIRKCLKAARAVYWKIPKLERPLWGDFWRDWLATHEDCH